MQTSNDVRNADLGDALSELSHLMLATPALNELLEQLARLAAEVVSPTAFCGITLQQHNLPLTVASSGPVASHLDEIQYGQDDGPCLQSMRTGEPVIVPDMVTERRWGTYPAYALGYGVRSCLSLPLSVDTDVRGALNLYAEQPDGFNEEDVSRARVFAAQTCAALAMSTRHAHQMELTGQLREALSQRAVIDQALGILMAQQGCDQEAAFRILRNASQHRNRKLRELAVDIVTAVGGHHPSPTPFNYPV
jgi:GAF domain-containing protein